MFIPAVKKTSLVIAKQEKNSPVSTNLSTLRHDSPIKTKPKQIQIRLVGDLSCSLDEFKSVTKVETQIIMKNDAIVTL